MDYYFKYIQYTVEVTYKACLYRGTTAYRGTLSKVQIYHLYCCESMLITAAGPVITILDMLCWILFKLGHLCSQFPSFFFS